MNFFKQLFPHGPFDWQAQLFESVQSGRPEENIGMPTASGKTYGILRCWLAGLANAPEKTPRRLVYVVNRRAVIDQVYEDALQLADLLKGSELGELFHKHVPGSRKGEPLSVYAFRGQRALDDSWLIWPAQPSILVGTVDMIGSRLLFRSYVGAGNWKRAQAAGLSAQDSWLVLDEPHLAEPFHNLCRKIATHQSGKKTFRPFWFSAIGATTRGNHPTSASFDYAEDKRLSARMTCSKEVSVQCTPIEPADFVKNTREIITKTLGESPTPISIGVIVSTVSLARQFFEMLKTKSETHDSPALFSVTGAMRGYDRDRVLAQREFRESFVSGQRKRELNAILVGTHCLEAGFDGDFDILISDISSMPSTLQRLGRLNRRGEAASSKGYFFLVTGPDKSLHSETARNAHEWLVTNGSKPSGNDSVALWSGSFASASAPSLPLAWAALSEAEKAPMSEPPRHVPEMTEDMDLLFACSSDEANLRELRPSLFLHGFDAEDQSHVMFAWRHEARLLDDPTAISEALKLCPPSPQEIAQVSFTEGKKFLQNLIKRLAPEDCSACGVWVADPFTCEVVPAFSLSRQGKVEVADLASKLVLISPAAGGYSGGFLDEKHARPVEDLRKSCQPEWVSTDIFAWSGSGLVPADLAGQCHAPAPDSLDEVELPAGFRMTEDASALFARSGLAVCSKKAQTGYGDFSSQGTAVFLADHREQVRRIAVQLCADLFVGEELSKRVESAAQLHDEGKAHHGFQHYLGNLEESPIAKSAKRVAGRSPFRHEILSVIDNPTKDPLVSHIIGTHHGNGRPCFSADRLPPRHSAKEFAIADEGWMENFAAVNARHGPWAIAWLESILKAADAIASSGQEEGPK